MNPMDPAGWAPFYSVPASWVAHPPPLPRHQLPPPLPPPSAAFWNAANVRTRLAEFRDTVSTGRAMQKELQMLILMKEKDGTNEGENREPDDGTLDAVSRFTRDNEISNGFHESASLNAANAIFDKLRYQLEPFRVVTDENIPWEEKSALKRLADKMQKHKRNKLWRKRKRKRIAENLVKEREQYDQKDKEADEWRAREIAKDVAQRKVEKMKEIAKFKAKEEKRKLEGEFEMVLIVEKLKELRSIRVEKMKKQGHFLPEEDDKFLERVRAAVEEEERLSMSAADTDASKDAIANTEEYRKHIVVPYPALGSAESDRNNEQNREIEECKNDAGNKSVQSMVLEKETQKVASTAPSSAANLPMEFYHYYYGSNADMGTLIEVRRTWDAYLRPGGSRIPGHWVQPPPPADDVWASYLVKNKPN